MGTLRELQFALKQKLEEIRLKDEAIDVLEAQLDERDALVERLQNQLEKYRSILKRQMTQQMHQSGSMYPLAMEQQQPPVVPPSPLIPTLPLLAPMSMPVGVMPMAPSPLAAATAAHSESTKLTSVRHKRNAISGESGQYINSLRPLQHYEKESR